MQKPSLAATEGQMAQMHSYFQLVLALRENLPTCRDGTSVSFVCIGKMQNMLTIKLFYKLDGWGEKKGEMNAKCKNGGCAHPLVHVCLGPLLVGHFDGIDECSERAWSVRRRFGGT